MSTTLQAAKQQMLDAERKLSQAQGDLISAQREVDRLVTTLSSMGIQEMGEIEPALTALDAEIAKIEAEAASQTSVLDTQLAAGAASEVS